MTTVRAGGTTAEVERRARPVREIALAQFVAAMPTAALLTDAEHRVVAMNAAFERLTGYRFAELRDRDCGVLLAPGTDERTVEDLHRAMVSETGFAREVLSRRRDGRLFWNSLQVDPVRDADDRIVGFLSTQRDVTETVRDRQAVADQLGTAELLLGGLPRFASSDPREVMQALCEATVRVGAPTAVLLREDRDRVRMMGSAGRRIGLSDDELWTLLAAADAAPAADAADGTSRGSVVRLDAAFAVVLAVRPHAARHAALVSVWTDGRADDPDHLLVAQRMGRLTQLGGLALDNLELIAHIRSSAETDDLTGLPSRTAVQSRLEQALRRGPRAAAVLYLDVDRFKRINDSLGHAGGDELLVQIAERLRDAVGSDGVAGRLGGDEFLVVLPGADDRAAAEVEGRIARDMREPFAVAERTVFARLSCGRASGVAIGTGRPQPMASQLMREADAAMYAVKRTRPHRDVDTALDLVELDADLRAAIERHELSTWFQPQYDGGSGALVGFEALVRWQHPRRGWIRPDVFVPVAEEGGLIGALGARVLDDAARFVAEQAARTGPLDVAVNVSRTELLDPAYVARVAAVLDRRTRAGCRLTLEVKETDLDEDPALRTALVKLTALGVAIVVDDFGRGSSSLRMLQDLPIDAIKIDEAFLRRDGALHEQLIAAVVRLGVGLGLEVMAAGIETTAQLETLRRLSCSRLQGRLLGAPLPPENLDEVALALPTGLRGRPG